jgi:hypothetical protein
LEGEYVLRLRNFVSSPLVTVIFFLASVSSHRTRDTTAALALLPILGSFAGGDCLHHLKHGLELFLAQKWRESARDGSGTGTLAKTWPFSGLVIRRRNYAGLVWEAKGPCLDDSVVSVDVLSIPIYLCASVRLRPGAVLSSVSSVSR